MSRILIVDDDELFTRGLAQFLRGHGHDVTAVCSLAEARAALGRSVPALMLLDLMLPDGNGLELLDDLAGLPGLRVVIASGHAGVTAFIDKLEGNNVSYLAKPIDPRDLLGLINATGGQDDEDGDEAQTLHFGLLVGEAAVMQKLYKKIAQVAPMDCTVFIRGESGTGKELVAEAVHRVSGRSGAYIPVNCGGLSKDIVSSELFGHEKGSFTGANKRHLGFFERAAGGTLFLDEITEMPLDLQTQLLRVLETETITRVGGEEEITLDARLIAATNRDPVAAIEQGKLREDLFFRLQVFPLELPPLRYRQGDVALLGQHFVADLNNKYEARKKLADTALAPLDGYGWPGNVRELKHAVHRAFIVADEDEIDAVAGDDFSAALEARNAGPAVGRSIADMERDLIVATLEHYGGDKKSAAATLGVSVKTLYNRLNDYKLGDNSD